MPPPLAGNESAWLADGGVLPLPAIHGNYTCAPLGDSVRRMRSRLTVAGTRAYLNMLGTVRVIELE